MKKAMIVVALLVLLAGCTGFASRLNRLDTGITKDEVVRVMGQPHTTSRSGAHEYLMYDLYPNAWEPAHAYFVLLVNGRVTKWGREGDFRTTDTVQRYEVEWRNR